MDRRTLLGTSVLGTIGTITGGVLGNRYAMYHAKEATEAQRTMNTSECHDNMVSTYSRSFAELHKGEILFFDEEGAYIDTFNLPQQWDVYTQDQKQQKRDEFRKLIAHRYNLPNSDEGYISASSPHLVLQGEQAGETLLTLVKKFGSKQTVGDSRGLSRIDYVRDAFRGFGGGGLIAELMNEHIAGLAAGESRFDSSLISRTGAVGIFQLMPGRIGDISLNPQRYTRDEVARSLKKQVEIAKRLFLADWTLIKSRLAEKIGKAYFDGNTEDTVRYALFPLLINTYNTGYTNMKAVVDGFCQEYPTISAIEEDFGVKYDNGMGYDFFWYLSRFGLMHNGAPSYRSDSAAYFYKSMAMSRVLNSGVPVSPTVIGTVAGGAMGVLAGSLISGAISQQPQHTAHNSILQSLTRRKALMLVGGAGAAGLVGWGVYSKLSSTKPETPIGSGEKLEPYQPQSGVPESVLRSIYPQVTKFESIPIDRKHQSKTITPWLAANAKNLGISPAMTRSDLKKLDGRLDSSLNNLDYRPREMGRSAIGEGGVKIQGSRNHPEYLLIRKHTEKIIREISQSLNLELKKLYGMDLQKYRVRLIISSGARDHAYAKKYLPNASDNSSHPYGIAFDIAPRFDIIDLKAQKSYMITSGEVYTQTKRVLDTVISRMQHQGGRFRGKVFAIQEVSPPHIHVSDRLSEETWVPPYLRG